MSVVRNKLGCPDSAGLVPLSDYRRLESISQGGIFMSNFLRSLQDEFVIQRREEYWSFYCMNDRYLMLFKLNDYLASHIQSGGFTK